MKTSPSGVLPFRSQDHRWLTGDRTANIPQRSPGSDGGTTIWASRTRRRETASLHLKTLGVHVCGFETSPYGVEWMRFDTHCQVPEIVKTVPHLAFVVDNLDTALQGKQILIPPNSPSPGVRVAFILDDGAPIELLEFDPDSD